ncbi:MAG TPA: shikimate dehydrogenase [Burkholderiales bacterium]|nr:shikimate dehydrogenase [Burkholderiales bacterium]
MADRYAVVGNPVAHSKSPLIHAEFARQTGQDMEYGRLLVPLDGFRAAVDAFRREGGRGLNVTLPFKLEAFALADRRSERALDAEAANTLKFDADSVFADNTDGVGLLRDLEVNLRFPLAGRRILVMGAGGAVQGTLGPLIAAHPALLTVANRTLDKAQRLVTRFGAAASASGTRLQASGYEALAGRGFDLVVNGTSASLLGTGLPGALPELPGGVFAIGGLAYDMMYGNGLTAFLQHAQGLGAARLADGIGMLVEQAAESFFLWRGVRPHTAPVIAQLKTL